MVLFYHIGFLFGDLTLVPRGYLCVDFFFLLSGFVVAYSYEKKLELGLGVFEFIVLRAARLWPLVALATMLALIVQIPRWQRGPEGLDPVSIVVSMIFNGAMLPSPVSPTGFLFPFNGAAWSIFFEVIANLAYVLLLPVLSRRTLVAIIFLGGCGLVQAAVVNGTADVGWSSSNFIYGFPRVAFTFFLGVYLWRILPRGADQHLLGPASLIMGLLATLAVLNVPRGTSSVAEGLIDSLIVIIAFPALLMLAVKTRFRAWGASAAWLLGGISYSVYLLQTPLMIGYSGLPQALFGTKIANYAPWSGFLFVALCLVVSLATWVYFEQPAQRLLKRALLGQKRHPKQASAGAIEK